MESGVEVIPNTEDDYKNYYNNNKLLQTEQGQFNTFELKSEKSIKVMFHGVPTEITTD